MSRVARSLLVIPGLAHHVILRGNNRRRLFSFDGCYRRFLHTLAAACALTHVPVHALALMANHVHLLVTPPDAPTLARFVQRAAQPYAMFRNATRGGTGKVFEQRYLAIPIRGEAQLAATLAYVDSNPLFAGLERNKPYRWSTRALHFGNPSEPAVAAVWTPHEWYLALGSTPAERATRYAAFVAERDERRLRSEAACDEDRDEAPPPRGARIVRPDGSRAW